jgi:hypothetical protein
MIVTGRPRRSSNRWDTLYKVDCPRAIDWWISYFGEVPSSSRTGSLTDADGHGQDIDLDRRAIGL